MQTSDLIECLESAERGSEELSVEVLQSLGAGPFSDPSRSVDDALALFGTEALHSALNVLLNSLRAGEIKPEEIVPRLPCWICAEGLRAAILRSMDTQ